MKRLRWSLGMLGMVIVLLSLVLSGCSGGGGGGGTAPVTSTGMPSVVTKVYSAVSTSICPAGGIQVDAGIDTNGNGVLDTAEVDSTQYVCNGANGSNGLTTLVSVINEPAGANCAAGGKKVSAGTDSNANGSLDPSEITSTNYICNGAAGAGGSDGLTSLVSVTSEPAGANCTSGGKKIRSGLDANGNGILDAPEIDAISYVCNGANGGSGTDGLISLVSTTTEPAGANCANGGNKISSGLDSNGNGILETLEVDATSYVCNGSNGSNGTDGLNTLVSIVSETSTTCPAGGLTVRSGLDANTNGTLDGGEVTSTNYVCNGSPGSGGSGITWVDVTSTAVQAAPNTGYLADSASLVTITLPDSPSLSIGDIVDVSGIGSGGWTIAQNARQSVIAKNLVGDSDLVWPVRDVSRNWYSVASSSDGTKLAAAEYGGHIYTSTDAGATWLPRDANRNWIAIASSADGVKLVAAEDGGRIYTSADSGGTWTPRESNRSWIALASSSTGTKLVAAVYGGQIYTSTDSGANWTARASIMSWLAVASSSDGTKLVAVVNGGQIYTSTNSGVSWTARDSSRFWTGVASSSDGTMLIATVNGGQIYTSGDSGLTWAPHEANRKWIAVASSSDGTKVAAVVQAGQIYTSSDSGTTWKVHDADRNWNTIASSADGARLVAAVTNGLIYTSTIPASTVGVLGSISGGQYDSISLQYIGADKFTVLSHEGYLSVQ